MPRVPLSPWVLRTPGWLSELECSSGLPPSLCLRPTACSILCLGFPLGTGCGGRPRHGAASWFREGPVEVVCRLPRTASGSSSFPCLGRAHATRQEWTP